MQQLPQNDPNSRLDASSTDLGSSSTGFMDLAAKLERLAARVNEVVVDAQGRTSSTDETVRQTQATPPGMVPVLPVPGVNDQPYGVDGYPNPQWDPLAGGYVEAGTERDSFSLDELTGITPVGAEPDADSIANAIVASVNEGSLNEQDAQLVAQFAQSLLGGVDVSGGAGGFDLSAAGGRLGAVAFRQREMLTEAAARDAGALFEAEWAKQQDEYFADIERHADDEQAVMDRMNVFSLDPREHKDRAFRIADTIIKNEHSGSHLKDVAEGYFMSVTGDPFGVHGPGELGFGDLVAELNITVGEAVNSVIFNTRGLQNDANGRKVVLEQFVKEGRLPASVLDLPDLVDVSDDQREAQLGTANISEEFVYGPGNQTDEFTKLMGQGLYTSDEVNEGEALLRDLFGIDERGNDGLNLAFEGLNADGSFIPTNTIFPEWDWQSVLTEEDMAHARRQVSAGLDIGYTSPSTQAADAGVGRAREALRSLTGGNG